MLFRSHELSASETAELAEAAGQNPARARDLRQHLALWELYAQRVAVERSGDAFVAAWETRLRAEADSDVFVERVGAQLSQPSKPEEAGPLRERPLRERPWRRWRRAASPWIAKWRVGFALAGATALLIAGFLISRPVVGQPMLIAPPSGSAVVVRAGTLTQVGGQFALLPMDIVNVTGTSIVTIAYAPENTHLQLLPGTTLKLLPGSEAKRFELRSGSLEAAVARQRLFWPLLVRTPQAEVRVLGTKFTLTTTTNATRLEVTEGNVRLTRTADGVHVDVPEGRYAEAATGVELNALSQTGSILREYWTNLPGDAINDLLDDARYPGGSSGHDYVDLLEVPAAGTTNYGCRLVGYLHPPVTGQYTFWIAASPSAAFNLSPDENPAKAVRLFTGGFDFGRGQESQPREWERKVINMRVQSQPITLLAGRRYYIEAKKPIEQCALLTKLYPESVLLLS